MKQKGFAPLIIILIIAVFGVVGYSYYRNIQIQKISFLPMSTPAATLFPENLKDVSLENFLRNKLKSCIHYSGDNQCIKEPYSATIYKNNGNYAFGGAGNDTASTWFLVAKQNGKWSYYIEGYGEPSCKDADIFPKGFLPDWMNKCK